MLQKKICMLGSFAVGKTSLVQRFVTSIFSEKYLTTVGVKIDKKTITANGQTVNRILWDLAGEDAFYKLQMSYLRGAAGYLVVVDGTRADTLETALSLIQKAETEFGKVPYVLLFNKVDLSDLWEFDPDLILTLREKGDTVFETSAKSGQNVEAAFLSLAVNLLDTQKESPD